jgi:hypothetical protein
MKEKIEKLLNLALPARLEKFWGTNEHLEYGKTMISGLPGYEPTRKFKVRFNDFSLFHSFMHKNGYFTINHTDSEYPKHLIPLTYLYVVGDVEQNYLTVDIRDDRHPVSMCVYETNEFKKIAEDLDSFLRLLQQK